MARSISSHLFDSKRKAVPVTASTPGDSTKKSGELDHLRLKEGESGGHIVEHQFSSSYTPGGDYVPAKETEPHVFGDGDGVKLVAHLIKHGNIKGVSPMAESERDEAEEEKLSPGIHKRVAKAEAKEDTLKG